MTDFTQAERAAIKKADQGGASYVLIACDLGQAEHDGIARPFSASRKAAH
jgi:hypothetical protein